MICVLPHPLEKLVMNKCLDSDLGFSHLLYPLILMFQSLQLSCIQTSQCSGYLNVCVRETFFKAHSTVSSLKKAGLWYGKTVLGVDVVDQL